jgi:cysteine-rich repeat protein
MDVAGECRESCAVIRCGDGITDLDEACDDGNAADDDGCRNDCTIARCGDGVVRADVEECDLGGAPTPECDYNETSCSVCDASACIYVPGKTSLCGDSVVDATNDETCDDGNTQSLDGCSEQCRLILWDRDFDTPAPGAELAALPSEAAFDPYGFPALPSAMAVLEADGELHLVEPVRGTTLVHIDLGGEAVGPTSTVFSLNAFRKDGRIFRLSRLPDAYPADAGVLTFDAGPLGTAGAAPPDGGAPPNDDGGAADAGGSGWPSWLREVRDVDADGGVLEGAVASNRNWFLTTPGGLIHHSTWAVDWHSRPLDRHCAACTPCQEQSCALSMPYGDAERIYAPRRGGIVAYYTDGELSCGEVITLDSPDDEIIGRVASLGNLNDIPDEGERAIATLTSGQVVTFPPAVTNDCRQVSATPLLMPDLLVPDPAAADAGADPDKPRALSHPVLFPLQGTSGVVAAHAGALVRFHADEPGNSGILFQDPSVEFQPYLTLDAEGYVYAMDTAGSIYKVHSVSGQLLYRRFLYAGELTGSLLVIGDAIFALFEDGKLIAVEGGGTSTPYFGAWSRDTASVIALPAGSCGAMPFASTPTAALLLALFAWRRRRRSPRASAP